MALLRGRGFFYSSANQSVPNLSRLIKTINDLLWGTWMPSGAIKCKAGLLEASLVLENLLILTTTFKLGCST